MRLKFVCYLRLFGYAEAAGFRTPHADRRREEDPGCWGLSSTKQTSSHEERGEGTEESPTEDQKQGKRRTFLDWEYQLFTESVTESEAELRESRLSGGIFSWHQ